MSTPLKYVVHQQNRAGTDLRCLQFGERGDWVVLVHGLCGYALEWRETAAWLVANGYRVLIPEQRGHGQSERRPLDVSRSAFVDDVEMWLTKLCLGPVVLVGHSLGAHTAFLVASDRPDLVRALVVAEATPHTDAAALSRLTLWLDAWPRPFVSRESALEFFGGDTTYGRAWTDGLEHRADWLWPRFDIDVVIQALASCRQQGYWHEWSHVTCPTLVVRGERGTDMSLSRRMCELVPAARRASIPGAAHDLHLEQPENWRTCLSSFLATLASPARGYDSA